MSKIKQITERATNDIFQGKFGKIGNKYLSVREFAKTYEISYVTATKVFAQLKNNGTIKKGLKNYFINFGSPNKKLSKKNLLLGIHVRDISNDFYSSLCNAISSFSSELGIEIIFMTSNNDNVKKRAVLNKFINLKCDGVVNLNSHKEYELIDYYKLYPLPMVFFGINPLSDLQTDFILTDNVSSGKLAAKHLYSCGARKFIYITSNNLQLESDDRQEGFKNYLSSIGIDDFKIFELESDKISSPQYAHLGNYLLKESCKEKLGVFCHHDGFASSVINICNSKKIKVPNEVAVLGYDNLPLTLYTTPQISTFSYDFKAIAKSCINSLIQRIDSPFKPSSTIIFPTHLMIRNSTKIIE